MIDFDIPAELAALRANPVIAAFLDSVPESR